MDGRPDLASAGHRHLRSGSSVEYMIALVRLNFKMAGCTNNALPYPPRFGILHKCPNQTCGGLETNIHEMNFSKTNKKFKNPAVSKFDFYHIL